MESCAAVAVFYKSNGGLNSDSLSHSLSHTYTHMHTLTHTHLHTCIVFEGSSVFCGASGSWTMGRQKEGWCIWRAGHPVYYCNAPLSVLPACLSPSLPIPRHDRAQGKSGAEFRATGSSFKSPLIHTHNMSRQPLLWICHSFPSLAPITESQFSPLRSLLLLSPPPTFSLLTTLSPGGLWQEAW